jgi:hypothetical protein
MSGYLTRLAARALSQAPAVHANARLPFFGTDDPLPEADGPTIETDRRPGIERDVEAPPITASAKPAAGSQPRTSAVPHPGRPLAISITQPAAAATPKARELGTPVPKPRVVQTPGPAVEAPSDPPLAPIGEPVLRPAVTPSPVPAAETPLARARAISPPIVRPRATERQTRERPPPAPEAARPDVHIHIGRIELTAAPDSPAPRRSSKPAKKPMSLDDYLQRRTGSSS